jgi:hypothetical protein
MNLCLQQWKVLMVESSFWQVGSKVFFTQSAPPIGLGMLYQMCFHWFNFTSLGGSMCWNTAKPLAIYLGTHILLLLSWLKIQRPFLRYPPLCYLLLNSSSSDGIKLPSILPPRPEFYEPKELADAQVCSMQAERHGCHQASFCNINLLRSISLIYSIRPQWLPLQNCSMKCPKGTCFRMFYIKNFTHNEVSF